MKIWAAALVVIGVLTILISLTFDTSLAVPMENAPAGSVGVISFGAQHKQLLALIIGVMMVLASTILFAACALRDAIEAR